VHDATLDLDCEQHVVAAEKDRVDVEEVGGDEPFAWAERNWVQVGPSRRGAGGTPWRRRTVATLIFDTRMPNFLSSPTMRRYPHREFSAARRQISLTVSSDRAGRPDRRCG
jgi:hypothetical protein